MVAVLRADAPEEKVEHLVSWLQERGLEVHISRGEQRTVLGLVGNTAQLDLNMLRSLELVESVTQVSDPFKACNRKFHPEDSLVDCGKGAFIGGGQFGLIAGPCSVEGETQISFLGQEVKRAGANLLRGGAFKPRTSPYDFQGMGKEGIDYLVKAGRETGLPVVTELMDVRAIDLFEDVDVIQIGARNTQNYDLLKALGSLGKPVLLKRGLAGTIKELLMSAEYIMASGNDKVILCERGIRTYENSYTRNTLDLSAVPVLKELTHLPVVVDPSHAVGKAAWVPTMALAAVAAGADGLMIEVHNDPLHAWSDGPQSLTPEVFEKTAQQIFQIRDVVLSQ